MARPRAEVVKSVCLTLEADMFVAVQRAAEKRNQFLVRWCVEAFSAALADPESLDVWKSYNKIKHKATVFLELPPGLVASMDKLPMSRSRFMRAAIRLALESRRRNSQTVRRPRIADRIPR
jgi:hypothetical protein